MLKVKRSGPERPSSQMCRWTLQQSEDMMESNVYLFFRKRWRSSWRTRERPIRSGSAGEPTLEQLTEYKGIKKE